MQKYSFSIVCLIIICLVLPGCTRKESAKENAVMQMKIKVYSKLIEINPNDPENAFFYVKRSNAYHKLGDTQKAKNDEIKYTELFQKLSDSTIDTGNLSGYMNNVSQRRDNIIAVCDEIISSDPKNVYAYVEKAEVLLVQRRFDETIAACSKAIEIDPQYAAAYEVRYKAYDMSGRAQDAQEDYKKAVDPGLRHN